MKGNIFIAILIVLNIMGISTALSQAGLQITEKQIIQVHLNGIQRGIQRSKPGDVKSLVANEITIDGQKQSGNALSVQLGAILSELPNRDIRASNPLPEKLGTFWDFEIIDPQYQFADSTCLVACKYRLYASGLRIGTGTFELVKQDDLWHIHSINGLVGFLTEEIAIFKPGNNAVGRMK